MSHITNTVAGHRLLNSFEQRFLSRIEKLLRLHTNVAYAVGPGRIRQPAVQVNDHINRNNISVLQRLLLGEAVADHIVHRSTGCIRIAVVAFLLRSGSL
ncbi:hypothetical protein D3C71_1614190 [compost metagenome]